MYIYHPKKIEIIKPCPYQQLLQIINYRKKGLKKGKDTLDYYLFLHIKWINSVIYLNKGESIGHILTEVMKRGGCQLSADYVMDLIKEYNPEGPHWIVETHFEWNESKINQHFNSDFKKIKEYKKRIGASYGRKGFGLINEEKTLAKINEHKGVISAIQLSVYLNKDIKTIQKILKRNDIKLPTEKSVERIKKLDYFFDRLKIIDYNEKLTVSKLSELHNIDRKTLSKILNDFPFLMDKLNQHNDSIKNE